MKRRALLTGGALAASAVAVGGVSACSADIAAPGQARTTSVDVTQPSAAMPGPEADPSAWRDLTVSVVALSVPAAMGEPMTRDGWGVYEQTLDVLADNGKSDHRVLVSGELAGTGASSLNDIVRTSNLALIEDYTELRTVEWENEDGTAVERTGFVWGPGGTASGWTWKITDGASLVVVTLMSVTEDDGLRNGLEESLALTGEQA